MKNKAPLALIELVVMTLVFALCAALCLRGLVSAELTKNADFERDQAVLCVQSTAEIVKYNQGDYPAETYYDADWQECGKESACYLIKVEKAAQDEQYLGTARISACCVSGGSREIIALTAAWQEDD